MSFRPRFRLLGTLSLAIVCLFSNPAQADRVDTDLRIARQFQTEPSFLERASYGANVAVDRALGLVGIRYRRGGTSPETGFDCSGFVSHVFRSVGTLLPHSAREMSKSSEVFGIGKNELQPGDLVFFNTMRRAFSHVGIYLGNNLFVHAPASGGEVRIDDLRQKYWGNRFNGARRISAE